MTGRIRDRLPFVMARTRSLFFMDIDDIPYGKNFRIHIGEAVLQSDVLLVIVDQRWLGPERRISVEGLGNILDFSSLRFAWRLLGQRFAACRSASRDKDDTGNRLNFVGFRAARTLS